MCLCCGELVGLRHVLCSAFSLGSHTWISSWISSWTWLEGFSFWVAKILVCGLDFVLKLLQRFFFFKTLTESHSFWCLMHPYRTLLGLLLNQLFLLHLAKFIYLFVYVLESDVIPSYHFLPYIFTQSVFSSIEYFACRGLWLPCTGCWKVFWPVRGPLAL